MIMIAETISLGILSLPSVLDTVGLVPYVSYPRCSVNSPPPPFVDAYAEGVY